MCLIIFFAFAIGYQLSAATGHEHVGGAVGHYQTADVDLHDYRVDSDRGADIDDHARDTRCGSA